MITALGEPKLSVTQHVLLQVLTFAYSGQAGLARQHLGSMRFDGFTRDSVLVTQV